YGHWTIDGPHEFCGEGKVRTYCSPLTIPPARHWLYRGKGDGTFEETTESAGVLRPGAWGRGLGVIAADLDLDGRTHLSVPNDRGPSFVFRNLGDGRFEDLTETSGAAYRGDGAPQASMGVDAVDVNGDGLPELLTTNYRGDYNTLYTNIDGRNFSDDSA